MEARPVARAAVSGGETEPVERNAPDSGGEPGLSIRTTLDGRNALVPVDTLPMAEGALRTVDCAAGKARLRLDVNGASQLFEIEDPQKVVLLSGGGKEVEFTCGPQKGARVKVRYQELGGKRLVRTPGVSIAASGASAQGAGAPGPPWHNPFMRITWLGHGSFHFRLASGQVILMDPWLEGNPTAPPFELDRVDTIAITHAHFDHIGSAVELAKLLFGACGGHL